MTSPTQNPGKELQSRREQLGYSLNDVAEHTRIRRVYLENMEQGQLEALPGQAYVTGFVRVYARYLGLDSDDILTRLNASVDADTDQSPEPDNDSNTSRKPDPESQSTSGWGAFVLGFAVVLALGSLFYFIPFSSDSGAPQEPSLPQQDRVVAVTEPPIEEAPAESHLPTVPVEGSVLRVLALTESSLILYLDGHEPREIQLKEGLERSWDVKTSVRVKLVQPGTAQFWLGRQELKLGEIDDFHLSTASGE